MLHFFKKLRLQLRYAELCEANSSVALATQRLTALSL